MNAFLIYMMKVAILSAVFIALYHLLLQRETYHRLNRIILVSSLVLSYILPFIVITIHREGTTSKVSEVRNIQPVETAAEVPYKPIITSGSVYSSVPETETGKPVPAQNITQVIEVPKVIAQDTQITSQKEKMQINWWKILIAVYLTGFIGFLIFRILSTVKVIRIIRKGKVIEQDRECTVVQTIQSINPFSWMKYIILPEKSKTAGLSQILDHEKSHLAHHHSQELLWTDILSALQWFNPALLLFRHDLCSIHEFQADADVLNKGYDRRQYQYLMLDCATDKTEFRAANTFRKSTLEGRIDMINRKKSSKSSILKLVYLPVLLLVSVSAFAETVYDKGLDETIEIGNYVRIDGLWYKFKDNEARVVSRKTVHPYPAAIVIPDTIIYKDVKYPVTSIGSRAFNEAEEIETVTIPYTIREIEDYSFVKCTGLKKIDIPSSVTKIGHASFSNCTSLQEVIIPESVTTIGDVAFEYCTGLKSIRIPASVKKIGRNSFGYCDLSNITVDPANRIFDSRENSNAIIETETNSLLTASSSTVIPASVTVLGDFAFSGIKGLEHLDIPQTVKKIGWRCFSESGIKSIRINSNPEYAMETFNNSTSLEEVEYGPDVTEIRIPQDCPNLKRLFIPATVTGIDFGSLNKHPNIETIIVEEGNPVYDSRDNCNAIIQSETDDLVFGCKNTVIPGTVKKISSNAFLGCSFSEFYIPASVVDIYPVEYALPDKNTTGSVVVDPANPVYDSREGCNAIIETKTNTLLYGCSNAFIPNSVKAIDDYAFQGIQNLKEISIPDGVVKMGHSAFRDCKNLEKVHFGAGITEIQPSQFLDSHKLSEITVSPANRKYDSRNNCNAVIETATGVLIIGGNKSTVPDGVTTIGREAFRFRDELKSLTLPPSVKTIEDMAFESCKKFESINLEYVTQKGRSIFNATPFESGQNIDDYDGFLSIHLNGKEAVITKASAKTPAKVRIPETIVNEGKEYAVVEIDDEAFNSNTEIESVSVPGTVRRIGSRAFMDCPNLKEVSLKNGLTSIGDNTFANCRKLERIKLPSTLESIGRFAFTRTSIRTLAIPASVTEIGNNIALDCKNLKSISVNSRNSVYDSRKKCNAIIRTDGNILLQGCNSTRIPDGIEIIGPYALAGMPGFKASEIPSSVRLILKMAFSFCTSIETINIPSSVVYLDGKPFFGCSSVKAITVQEGNPTYFSPAGSNAIISNGNSVKESIDETVFSLRNGYDFDFFENTWNWAVRPGRLVLGCSNTVIPQSATAIGTDAFAYCKGLEKIRIPESVTVIEGNAFSYCSDLKEIVIPASVRGLEKSNYCPNLERIVVDERNPVYNSRGNCNAIISTENNELVWGCKNTVIPETVNGIGQGAFRHVPGLKTIVIPESVTYIEANAFQDCGDLETINIPASVIYLAGQQFDSPNTESSKNPFGNCTKLKSITVDSDNPYWDSRNNCNAIIETSARKLAVACSETVLPESVKNRYSSAYETIKEGRRTDYLSAGSVYFDGWIIEDGLITIMDIDD